MIHLPSALPSFACLPFALLALAGCGETGGNGSEGAAPTAQSALPSITPATGFPAEVTSFTGQTVRIESAPRRLLCGNAGLLEIAVELIDPSRMAALPATVLAYSTLDVTSGPWKDVPSLAKFEAEPVIASNPDLIVVQSYQLGSTVDRLIEHGLPVIVMPVISTWEEQEEFIRRFGRLLGEDDRATGFIAQLGVRAEALQSPTARTGLRVLPYGNYGSGGSTAGAGSTWQVMIELANMRNAATQAGLEGHPGIDFEQVLAIDPDFFLISLSSATTGSSAEAILMGEPLLASLRAIREKRFLRLPEALYSSASHELLRAAEAIAEQADGQLKTD